MEAILSAGNQPLSYETTPMPTGELFTIPLEEGKFIIYAPLQRAAFVANSKVVNFLAGLQEGCYNSIDDPDGSLAEFLRQVGILDVGPEQLPVTTFSGEPMPTSVTLFLTTACNLRCTYCYAAAGDTPLKSMPLDVAKRGINFVANNALKKTGTPLFDCLSWRR